MLLMRAEQHKHKDIYTKCLQLIEDDEINAAIEVIHEHDYESDSTLCVLLSKCLCPSFPNISLDDEDLELFDEIPTDLQVLLDATQDRSDENLDMIIEKYYENKDNLSRNSEEALRLIERAANLGDEIARCQLLTYYANNIQYLEDNQLIFLFVDLLEKADDAAYELIDFAIDAFKRMSMYESAYFYYLVKKAQTQIAYDDYEQLSLLQMISASQRKEVEQDLLIYLKNRLILNKYSNLL